MDRKISFFSYEQCFKSYQKRIESVRQHRINGETIIAKPVLMVAIIDAIDSNVFTSNQFVINDWLKHQGLVPVILMLEGRGMMEDV